VAKGKKDFTQIYDAVMSSTDEELTPVEVNELKAEAGEAVDAVEAPENEPTPAPEEPQSESKPAVEPEKPEKKPLSPAQERIQELVKERNEYEEALRNEREKWARLEERQNLIKEQAAATQRAEEAAAQRAAENARRAAERPDASIDPMGAQVWDLNEKTRMLEQKLAEAQTAAQNGFAQAQVNQDIQQFSNALQADLMHAKGKFADYDQAANYASQARFKFWKDLGWDDGEAARRVQAESLAVAKDALDHGKSPGEVYYNLATSWGYKSENQGSSRGADVVGSPEARLAQQAAGAKVQGFGGANVNVQESETADIDNLSPAQLASMSEDQFLTLLRNPKSARALQQQISKMELLG
jgi:hypothetical protein